MLDQGLLAGTAVNVHPLVNTRTTSLSPEGLLAFLDATGHTPVLLDLAADVSPDSV